MPNIPLITRLAAVSLAAGLIVAPAAAANAATPAVTHYASCAAVHKVYSGGIAKPGVTMNTIHHKDGSVTKTKLKGTVKHSTSLYNANKKLDSDKDGVACEKS